MLPTALHTSISTMRTTTALCVLGALLVPAVMAMDASPMFAELLHASKAGPSSRAKISSAHEKVQTQHICLQETKQYNCRFVGCPDLAVCANPGSELSPCYNCRHHNVYMSDLTCCGDQEAQGYGDGNGFGAGVNAPTLHVGSCTWDVNLYRTPGDLIDGTEPLIRQSNPTDRGAMQIGTAWATCYLTSGVEYCGEGALCDNMVLTFKGGVYVTDVRSTLPTGLDEELTCLKPKGDSWWVYESIYSSRLSTNNSTNTTVTTNTGFAIMMSGPVTLTSMDQPLAYGQGYMDYVAQFIPDGTIVDRRLGARRNAQTSPTTEPPMLVTPNTYRIKLAARKGKEMYHSAAQ